MEIIKFKSLRELEQEHEKDIKGYEGVLCRGKSVVTDILETDIMFSYRVFLKNGNTEFFKSYIKEI